MLCLTVCQPYAFTILTGEKVNEYRKWATPHRGPLAIHAGLSTTWLVKGWRDVILPSGTPLVDVLTFGAVLGVVYVTGCVCGKREGSYAWRLARPRWLDTSIACKGKLKLWNLPAAVEAAVLAQLGGLT